MTSKRLLNMSRPIKFCTSPKMLYPKQISGYAPDGKLIYTHFYGPNLCPPKVCGPVRLNTSNMPKGPSYLLSYQCVNKPNDLYPDAEVIGDSESG